MITRFILGIFLLAHIACSKVHDQKLTQDVTIVDIIDQSKKARKMALIYLSSVEEDPLDMTVLCPIKNKLILYKVNNKKQNIISKLFHTDYSPLFILLNGDSLISIFTKLKDINVHFDKSPFTSDSSSQRTDLKLITKIESDNENILSSLNQTMQLKYKLDKGFSNNQLQESAKKAVNTLPYFYNIYLMSKIYTHTDSIKTVNLYDSLWISATNLDRKIYVTELLDIHDNISRRSQLNNSKLDFPVHNHDFGNIQKKDTVQYRFVFTNRGKNPAIIMSVNTSCECTAVAWPRNPLLPGESYSINVRYIPKDTGMTRKTIDIRTSEPAYISLCLYAKVSQIE